MGSTISFDLLSLIAAIGAIQGFICAFIALFSDKGGRRTNLYFALLIGSISLSVGLYVPFKAGLFISIPWIMKLSDILQFVFGPALYLYARELTAQRINKREIDFLHFLPAAGVALFIVPFFFLGYEQQLRLIISAYSGPMAPDAAVFEFASNIHVWIYIVLSLNSLVRYRKRIRESFSSIEEINLGWLKIFLTGMALVYTIFLLLQVLIFFGVNMEVFMIFTIIIGSGSVYYLAFIYLKYINNLSHTINLVRKEESGHGQVESKKEDSKYTSSPLTEKDLERFWQDLSDLMKKEQLYLQQELSLSSLADKMELPRQYLSQVINRRAGVNFYDFINSYRVEEFIRLASLPENSNYTILSIAYDAGFNSKASFNSFFKKSKGMTPSQYINNVKNKQ